MPAHPATPTARATLPRSVTLDRSPSPSRTGTLAVALTALALGACAGDPPPPPPSPPQPVREHDPRLVRVGGTGAMAPVAAALAAAWADAGRTPRVVVTESIGSGGGIRAAADGVLDLGMISRPLSNDEQRLGLHVVPAGRDAVVIAANVQVPYDGLASEDLIALYGGTRRSFIDGTPAVLLLRDRDESANLAMDRMLPVLGELRERAYRAGSFRVLYHDDAMGEALASTRGAMGVFALSAVVAWRLPLKVMAIDGVRPSVETIADGSWRATRELAFVARPDRRGHVRPFLEFVASPTGREVLIRTACLPAGHPAPR